jgi:hypothetical protein
MNYQYDTAFWTYWKFFSDNSNRKVRGQYPNTDCQHTSLSAGFVYPQVYHFGSDVQVMPRVSGVFSLPPSDVLSALPVVPAEVGNEVALDALQEWSEQVPADLDLPNFVYELREIEGLIPRFKDTLLKTVADGYLNLEFGWKPFLRDLSALAGIVSSTRAKIDHLIEINRRETRLSTVRGDVYSIPFWRDWVPSLNSNVQRRLQSYRADIRVGARLYADLEGLRDESNFWRAMTAALGLNNPLKSFWESVPFSFFFDWFSPALRRLFNLTANPYRGEYSVRNLCFTVSETAVVEYRYAADPSHNGGLYPSCGRVAVTRYTRYAGFPVQSSIFNLESLTTKQQTLFLALLHSGAGR